MQDTATSTQEYWPITCLTLLCLAGAARDRQEWLLLRREIKRERERERERTQCASNRVRRTLTMSGEMTWLGSTPLPRSVYSLSVFLHSLYICFIRTQIYCSVQYACSCFLIVCLSYLLPSHSGYCWYYYYYYFRIGIRFAFAGGGKKQSVSLNKFCTTVFIVSSPTFFSFSFSLSLSFLLACFFVLFLSPSFLLSFHHIL